MRISPINASLYVQQKNHSKNLRKVTPDITEAQFNPAFKNNEKLWLTAGATVLSTTMALLSGGATLWTIPALGGFGYLGDKAVQSSEKTSAPQYDPSAYEPISACEWI